MTTRPSLPLAYAIYNLLPDAPMALHYTAIQEKLREAGVKRTSEVVRATTRMLHALNHAQHYDDLRRFWAKGPVRMTDPGGKIGSTASFDWTDARKEELRRLRVDEKRTETEIASIMATTKGTITGQCSRMKLISPLSERMPGRQRVRAARLRLPTLAIQMPARTRAVPPADKDLAFRAAWKRSSLRVLAGMFEVSHQTVITWGRNLALGDRETVMVRPKLRLIADACDRPYPGGRRYDASYPVGCCLWMVSDGKPWMACGARRNDPGPYCDAHLRQSLGRCGERGFTPHVGGLNFQGAA